MLKLLGGEKIAVFKKSLFKDFQPVRVRWQKYLTRRVSRISRALGTRTQRRKSTMRAWNACENLALHDTDLTKGKTTYFVSSASRPLHVFATCFQSCLAISLSLRLDCLVSCGYHNVCRPHRPKHRRNEGGEQGEDSA